MLVVYSSLVEIINGLLPVWCQTTSKQFNTQKVDATLLWRHNGLDGISNHQPQDCFLKRLFRCRSKKTSKLCATGICAGNSPGTGEFPVQMASNVENVSIWWRHHDWKRIELYSLQIIFLEPQFSTKTRAITLIWLVHLSDIMLQII